jgi:hypothetical protein
MMIEPIINNDHGGSRVKNSAQLFVAFALSFLSFLANAEIIKIPVDPSVTAASGVPGYDPTVVGKHSSGTGWHVQPSSGSSGGSVGSQSTISPASTFVGSLIRWPAGGKPERVMQNATAYYRDAFIGIRYTAYANQDGDYWTVKAVYPTADGDGRTQTTDWSQVRYYAQVGGTPSCWYSAGWLYYICGTTSLDITAYKLSQCDPAGNWTLQVYENGGAVGGPQPFVMRLEVPLDELKAPIAQSIADKTKWYDSVCYVEPNENNKLVCDPYNIPWSGVRPFTIGALGCAMTTAAMVGEYHGAAIGGEQGLVDMNDWLVQNKGFVPIGNLSWPQAASYANTRGANSVHLLAFGDNNPVALRSQICTFGPQGMAVKNGHHFVMAVGRTENSMTTGSWKIHDPAGGVITTLADYGDTYSGTRLYFTGNPAQYPFPIYGITLRLYSPAELLVIAPDGKKTGLDPITGRRYAEIPNSSYQEEGYDNLETGVPNTHPTKFVDLSFGPAEGEYTIQVTGTGNGLYSLEVSPRGADGAPLASTDLKDVPTQPGLVHTYALPYVATPAVPLSLSGGYDGGGQKPSDVNRFLRYSSPSETRTSLPSGTTSFRMGISYGDTVDASTFAATLNGVDVRNLFSPASGKSEVITLPLAVGSNTLTLSISGATVNGRVATDTDRLVFLVQ